MICSAGLEFRDYPTLVEAVDGLDVRVVIGAASHWSKRRNTAAGTPAPSNVEVDSFDYCRAARALCALGHCRRAPGRRRFPGRRHDHPRSDGHGQAGHRHP